MTWTKELFIKQKIKIKLRMKLTKEDLGNLFDIYYMLSDNEEFIETLKLNKIDKWWQDLFNRVDEIVIERENNKD
jgi:hypothetical protein